MAPANAVAAAARKPSSDVEATVPSTQCFGVWRAERQRIAVMARISAISLARRSDVRLCVWSRARMPARAVRDFAGGSR